MKYALYDPIIVIAGLSNQYTHYITTLPGELNFKWVIFLKMN